MSFSLRKMALFTFAFQAVMGFAVEDCPCEKTRFKNKNSSFKTYVAADKVFFNENKIFVSLDEQLWGTTAIHVDQGGLYAKKVWRIDTPCPDDPHAWKCARCRHCNPYYKRCCSVCNHDQDDRECR